MTDDDADPMPTGDLDAIDHGDPIDAGGGYVPSILRAPPACPECGGDMVETHVYHPVLYERVPAWECEKCGYEEVREE